MDRSGSQEDAIAITALYRGVGLAGGVDLLARRIQVPVSALLAYAAGQSMPRHVFLAIVDFILEEKHFDAPPPKDLGP